MRRLLLSKMRRLRLLAAAVEPWDYELSVRSRTVLRYEEIKCIADLTSRTERELLRLPNFGQRSLKEVKGFLAKRGLELSE